jgi:hypothetical protein
MQGGGCTEAGMSLPARTFNLELESEGMGERREAWEGRLVQFGGRVWSRAC